MPKHLLKRDQLLSAFYILRDVAFAVAFYKLTAYIPFCASYIEDGLGLGRWAGVATTWGLWSTYCWFQGLVWAGIFCLGTFHFSKCTEMLTDAALGHDVRTFFDTFSTYQRLSHMTIIRPVTERFSTLPSWTIQWDSYYILWVATSIRHRQWPNETIHYIVHPRTLLRLAGNASRTSRTLSRSHPIHTHTDMPNPTESNGLNRARRELRPALPFHIQPPSRRGSKAARLRRDLRRDAPMDANADVHHAGVRVVDVSVVCRFSICVFDCMPCAD